MGCQPYHTTSLACLFGLSSSYLTHLLCKDSRFQYIEKRGPLYVTDPTSLAPHIAERRATIAASRRDHGRRHGKPNLVQYSLFSAEQD
jgi:hypothetical protein